MSWHFDWASALIGALATWGAAFTIVLLLARAGRKPPANFERMPAIPRWAGTKRDDALETEPDPFDVELQRLIDDAGTA